MMNSDSTDCGINAHKTRIIPVGAGWVSSNHIVCYLIREMYSMCLWLMIPLSTRHGRSLRTMPMYLSVSPKTLTAGWPRLLNGWASLNVPPTGLCTISSPPVLSPRRKWGDVIITPSTLIGPCVTRWNHSTYYARSLRPYCNETRPLRHKQHGPHFATQPSAPRSGSTRRKARHRPAPNLQQRQHAQTRFGGTDRWTQHRAAVSQRRG